MAKKKVKEFFRFDNSHVLFFIALAVNYIWRYVQDFMFNSFDSFWKFAQEVKPEFVAEGLKWWPDGLGSKLLGWTFDGFMSVVVWVLSLYTLYLIYLNIREKRQVVTNWVLLIFGVLFYIVTIFY